MKFLNNILTLPPMLNSITRIQECDATNVENSIKAGNTINKHPSIKNLTNRERIFVLSHPFRGTGDGLFKSIQPCHIHSRYQQMNIMCSFISDHTFQIHHMPHHRIFASDAHAAKHLSCITTNICCYFA